MINVKFTNHFIQRMKERCEFIDEKTNVHEFLAKDYTIGIICHPLYTSISYLGLPELNARIPLKKISDKTYISLTYVKGVVYIGYSNPCTINWVYDEDSTLDNEIKKLDDYDDELGY